MRGFVIEGFHKNEENSNYRLRDGIIEEILINRVTTTCNRVVIIVKTSHDKRGDNQGLKRTGNQGFEFEPKLDPFFEIENY